MKSIVFIAIAMSLCTLSATAQSNKKETVKVWGNCEMCQKRIEKAALKAGASTAKWDVDTKVLAVSYNPSKGTLNSIEKAVATSGYDTEHMKATEEGYEKLPECCRYDRKPAEKKQPD